MNCRICNSASGDDHLVLEMMFGSRKEFRYFECGECGCLQLIEPPEDMAEYYPADRYYAFCEDSERVAIRNPMRRWIKQRRDATILFRRRGTFAWLASRRPNPGISDIARWLGPTPIHSFNGPILDVGCGNGQFLNRLAALGFTDLTGVDPFLPADVCRGNVSLLARPIESVIGRTFDLVTFHHSLEHMPDQIEVLKMVRQMLNGRGVCLIRIPIVSQGPWRRYGTDWCEIDAPRHFFLHSELSLQIAASAAGLRVEHIQYEAEPFAYAVSELYRRGIPMYDVENKRLRNWEEEFSTAEIESFTHDAARFNVPGWAGRAAFFLTTDTESDLSVSFA